MVIKFTNTIETSESVATSGKKRVLKQTIKEKHIIDSIDFNIKIKSISIPWRVSQATGGKLSNWRSFEGKRESHLMVPLSCPCHCQLLCRSSVAASSSLSPPRSERHRPRSLGSPPRDSSRHRKFRKPERNRHHRRSSQDTPTTESKRGLREANGDTTRARVWRTCCTWDTLPSGS